MTSSLECFLYMHENLVPSSGKVKMPRLVAHAWIPSGREEEIGGSLGACWSSSLAWSVSFRPKVWQKQIKSGVDGWLTLHRFWALNSGHQASATSTSDCWALSLALQHFLKVYWQWLLSECVPMKILNVEKGALNFWIDLFSLALKMC